MLPFDVGYRRGHRPRRLAGAGIGRSLSALVAALVGGLVAGVGSAAAAAETAQQRWRAPIVVTAPAPFIEVELPPAVYARAAHPDLRDLRLADAKDERVPFALLAPPTLPPAADRSRPTTLYPLPPRPAGGGAWALPVEVSIDGDRIVVRRGAGPAVAGAASSAGNAAAPGWLIDLGEPVPSEPLPRRLRLSWSGPAEFSAGYAIETSNDLRAWRPAGGGQVMALQSASGALTQPDVVLPDAAARFVRLVWADPASAPVLTSAAALAPTLATGPAANATRLTFAPVRTTSQATGNEPRGALYFDLGGDLPIVDIDLKFAAHTHVAPVRIQGRSRDDAPWRDLGSGVFYRLERSTGADESPALALRAQTRYLRLVPDERAAALNPSQTSLVVGARLASLVFAAAGEAPFHLLAGAADATAGALPLSALVPDPEAERARFGRASLGTFNEVEEVAGALDRARSQARLRPWLLWGVIVIGVVALGGLVWRLARGGAGRPSP